MDDAAGGRRGTRATVSAELTRFLRARWGVRSAAGAPDLGGSSNLNLLVTDGRSLQVARIYRPFVTGQRVAALQAVRHHLASHGVPCAEPIPARGGRGWETFQGRAVEVEPYVPAPSVMNTLARVRTGLAVLGRIHALLRAFPADVAAAAPRFTNYVPADGLVEAVAVGTRRIRSWQPTPAEARLADLSDQLAVTVAGFDLEHPGALRRQLVHGDFWDDNVRFRNQQVALVTDFDFLGERPRIDDLALTMYYTSVDITRHHPRPRTVPRIHRSLRDWARHPTIPKRAGRYPARDGTTAAVVHRGVGGPPRQPGHRTPSPRRDRTRTHVGTAIRRPHRPGSGCAHRPP